LCRPNRSFVYPDDLSNRGEYGKARGCRRGGQTICLVGKRSGSPSYAIDRLPTSARKRVSNDVIALRYDQARSLTMGFSIFVTLSFVSYAAYAHQWSELSALRHLGKVPPAVELNAPLPALTGATKIAVRMTVGVRD